MTNPPPLCGHFLHLENEASDEKKLFQGFCLYLEPMHKQELQVEKVTMD